jgi:transcriptional regulator with GAF, ATPase, and Fis domain
MTVVETVTSPSQPRGAARVHRLLLVHSPHSGHVGRSALLEVRRVILGRSSSAEGFPLDDAEVSRSHAELEPISRGFALRDSGSRNGTFVNGRRLEGSLELQTGDVIRLGAHLLLYQSLDEIACRHLLDPIASSTPLIGTGHAMAHLRHAIHLAAPGNVPVLIEGETGVGKELVAQQIHIESGRTGAIVALNCSALPETLAESELFGHVGGAFTGAQRRQGLVFRAQGGTLFLDEVGEMALALQKKLLRLLSSGEARPVGSDHGTRVDVRVVAATNVDLERAVAAGTFRADLYARLAGHLIHVPPLRERREDIMVLLHHFLRRLKLQAVVTADAAEALLVHSWPFNVRELEQSIGALGSVLRSRRRLGLGDLPDKIRGSLGERQSLAEPVKSRPPSVLGIRRDVPPTRDELLLLLDVHRGNVSEIAAFFGKGRRQVYRWAKHLGIDVRQARTMRPMGE